MKRYARDDLILCTVKKIEGTSVFVDIENGGNGTIIMSEVSAGRIRNLRDFVTIGKKIVCKVLKVSESNIDLSLRRVTAKEREEVLEQNQKRRTFLSMIKTLKSPPENVIEKIENDYDLTEFLEEVFENPKILEGYLNKEDAEKLARMLCDKTEKEKQVKKTFKLSSISPNGLEDIKLILSEITGPNIKISYLGSSKFTIEIKDTDYKKAETKIKDILCLMEKKAKTLHVSFENIEK